MDEKRWKIGFDKGDGDEGLRIRLWTPWLYAALTLIPNEDDQLAMTLDVEPT